MSLLRIKELEGQLARRDARIAELECDAARYRWLREEGLIRSATLSVCDDDGYEFAGDRLDEAIDAAMNGSAT